MTLSFSFPLIGCVLSDEDQGNAEEAGPSQAQPCCSDSQPNASAATQPPTDLNHTQPSVGHDDTDTSNGSEDRAEPLCGANSNCEDNASHQDPSSGSDLPVEPTEPKCEAAEEKENEEDKQEEACSPSLPANEQSTKRRLCRKRRKNLFTIQAVNSNGTTERGMGEGGSAVSFSCKSDSTFRCFNSSYISLTGHLWMPSLFWYQDEFFNMQLSVSPSPLVNTFSTL